MEQNFIEEIKYRGYFNDCTNLEGLTERLESGMTTAYLGFDLTAKSLHVGSLMQIMLLRWFQKHGHKPIILLGGGTTKVGDPSGKDKERELLTDTKIEENKQSLAKIFAQFIDIDGASKNSAMMVDNSAWLDKLNYLEFLRDIGRHMSINRMLTFDSVKLRLDREQSLSFLEFNYMILQAYDFTALNREHNCELQFGGSDQWGNIVNGIELNRRIGQGEVFGLTTPLLTTASGKKMGKSESGAVWLNADMLSPYDYWQFWRNTEDADVIKFIKMFTELGRDQISELEKLSGRDINQAKIILANEATALCHGKDQAKLAFETAQKTFEKGDAGSALPRFELSAEYLASTPIYKLLVECGLAKSGGEAKRMIVQNAVKINNSTLVDSPDYIVPQELFVGGSEVKLSMGKKRHVVVTSLGI